MRKKLVFPFLALLLLTPWPVVYAHDTAMAAPEPTRVEAAEASAAPSWEVFDRAIGGVTTPGDLFYVDNTDNPVDILAALHITNTDELIHCYSYLILNVGVYVQTGADQWERAAMGNGELVPDTYITMQSGRVSFYLPAYARYKVTIDRGCFYSTRTEVEGGSIRPKFYLTVE